jgi:predicted enzyme related to lactoylglutathione lyase
MTDTINSNETRLDFISLQVRDLIHSKLFYQNILGFGILDESRPDAVVFKTGMGAIFAIRKPIQDLDQVSHLGWGIGLWFHVPDVKKIFEKGNIAGISIIQPPVMGPFGEMIIIADPDGYNLTLHSKQ